MKMAFNERLKETGIKGEKLARLFIKESLKPRTFNLMQFDWIVELEDRIIIFEIKTQEQYNNPNGHGLPPYQIRNRLKVLKLFKIKASLVLLVVCLTDKCVYSMQIGDNWEEAGFYTKTKKRFIFNIENFTKHETLNKEVSDLINFYNNNP